VKSAARFNRDGLKAASIGADPLGIKVGEDIEGWVEAVDLAEMRFGELAHRNLAGTKKLKLPDRRLKNQLRSCWTVCISRRAERAHG
jgi:hypothetical protein